MSLDLVDLRRRARERLGEECADPTCSFCPRNIKIRDAVLAALDVVEACQKPVTLKNGKELGILEALNAFEEACKYDEPKRRRR